MLSQYCADIIFHKHSLFGAVREVLRQCWNLRTRYDFLCEDRNTTKNELKCTAPARRKFVFTGRVWCKVILMWGIRSCAFGLGPKIGQPYNCWGFAGFGKTTVPPLFSAIREVLMGTFFSVSLWPQTEIHLNCALSEDTSELCAVRRHNWEIKRSSSAWVQILHFDPSHKAE